MNLVIRNARIVTADRVLVADIDCRDGLIQTLEPAGTAPDRGAEVFDADGFVVFPGFIDPHVHSRDPGQTHKEDFAHVTRAAAAAGITTVFDMPNAIPPITDADVLRQRIEQHTHGAFVDFALWGLVLGSDSVRNVGPLASAGAIGLKIFWGYFFDRATGALVYDPGNSTTDALRPPAGTDDLWDLFDAAAEHDVIIGLHAEDRGILDALKRRRPDYDTYDGLLETRPPAAEAAAIAVAIEIAMATRARLHVLHVSSARGAALIAHGRADGARLSAETCPHYLTLTAEDFARVGPAMKVFPPIREREHSVALWSAIHDGVIDSVSSDHAPHALEERRGRLSQVPAGGFGAQTIVQVMLNEVATGRATLQRLSWVLSEGTARIYGLYPRKGSVDVGTDADFTIVDPEAAWEIDQRSLETKTKLSPWHGTRGRGRAVATVVGGRLVMRDGELIGEPHGRFVRRRDDAT